MLVARTFLISILWFAFAMPASAQSWRSETDYPERALREGREGNVKFRLDISEEGKVKGCQIIESSGSEDLDTESCRIMSTRVKFTPAKDASGKSVPDVYFGNISWKIPQ